MMLTIYGIPSSLKYYDLKALIQRECNIGDFILDGLTDDVDGNKKTRIGVADEGEGAHLCKCLNGFRIGRSVLRVLPVGKPPKKESSSNLVQLGGFVTNQPGYFANQSDNFSNQPGNFSNQPGNFSNQPSNYNNQPGNYSNQSGNFHNQPGNYINQPGNFNNQQSRAGPLDSTRQSNQWLHNPQQHNQTQQTSFEYQQKAYQQFSPKQQSGPTVPRPGAKSFIQPGPFNQSRPAPEQGFGFTPKLNVPPQVAPHRRAERSLRSVEITQGAPGGRYPDQGNPVTINKNFFQGATQLDGQQGYPPHESNEHLPWNKPTPQKKLPPFGKPDIPTFENKRDIPKDFDKARPALHGAPERRLSPHKARPALHGAPGRRLSPHKARPALHGAPERRLSPHKSRPALHDVPERRLSPHKARPALHGAPERKLSPHGRGPLRISPGRRVSSTGRRMSPGTRLSPPGTRVSSVGGRVSPTGRRLSPGRRMSPGQRISPRRKSPGRPPPSRRLESPPRDGPRYSPPRRHDKIQFDDCSKQVKAPNQAMYSGGYRPNEKMPYPPRQVEQRPSPWQDRDKNVYPGIKKQDDDRRMIRGVEPEAKRSPKRKSRSPNRRDGRERSPLRDRYRRHSPSPRSPRRSWALEKRNSPEINEAPPPPVWPGQNQEDHYGRSTGKPEPTKHVPVWDHRSYEGTKEELSRDNRSLNEEQMRLRREAGPRDMAAPGNRRELSPRRHGFKPPEEQIHRDPKFEPRDPKFEPRDPKFVPRDIKYEPHVPQFEQRDAKFVPRDPTYEPRHPKFGPHDPKFEQRDAKYEPKLEQLGDKYDSRDPKLQPHVPRFASHEPKFEQRGPTFEPRDAKFEQRDPKFDNRGPKFEIREPKFEPRGNEFSSGFQPTGPKIQPRDSHFDLRDPNFEPRNLNYEHRELKFTTNFESGDHKFQQPNPKFYPRESKYEPRDPKFQSRDLKFELDDFKDHNPRHVDNRPERKNHPVIDKYRDYQRSEPHRDDYRQGEGNQDNRKAHEIINKEFEDKYKRPVDYTQGSDESKRGDHGRDREEYSRDSRRREAGDDRREMVDSKRCPRDDHHNIDFERRHQDSRSDSRHSAEYNKHRDRQPDWQPREMQSKRFFLPLDVKAKRDTAISDISRRLIQKYVYEMDDEIKHRVKDELKLTLGKILFKQFSDKDISVTDLVETFKSKQGPEDEIKIIEELMACFPKQHRLMMLKRLAPDKDRSEVPAKRLAPDSHLKDGPKAKANVRPVKKPAPVKRTYVKAFAAPKHKAVEPAQKRPAPPLASLNANQTLALDAATANALEAELQQVMIEVWQQLPDEASTAGESAALEIMRNEVSDDLKDALGLNVTKRLLNTFNPLNVKVHFSTKPERQYLSLFLKRYNFVALKRIVNMTNTFAAQVKTIAEYDELCSNKKLYCGTAKLTIKPCYRFTQCPKNLTTIYGSHLDDKSTSLKECSEKESETTAVQKESKKENERVDNDSIKKDIAAPKSTKTEKKKINENLEDNITKSVVKITTTSTQTIAEKGTHTTIKTNSTTKNAEDAFKTPTKLEATKTVNVQKSNPVVESKTNTTTTKSTIGTQIENASETKKADNTTADVSIATTKEKPANVTITKPADLPSAKATVTPAKTTIAKVTPNKPQAQTKATTVSANKVPTKSTETTVAPEITLVKTTAAKVTSNKPQAQTKATTVSANKVPTKGTDTTVAPEKSSAKTTAAKITPNKAQAQTTATKVTANSGPIKSSDTAVAPDKTPAKPTETIAPAKVTKVTGTPNKTPAKPTETKVAANATPAKTTETKVTPNKTPDNKATTKPKPKTHTTSKPAQDKTTATIKPTPKKTSVTNDKKQANANNAPQDDDFEELDDHGLYLYLMSAGIVLDECSASDED